MAHHRSYVEVVINTKRIKGSIAASSLLLGVMLAATACNVDRFDDSKAYRKTETHSFSTATDGRQVLPDWVPPNATAIDEIVRTTGDERILRMKSSTQALDHPGCAEIDGSDARPPSLSASWRQSGVESASTVKCGDWYVAQAGEYLFAHKPEAVQFILNQLEGNQ